MNHTMASEEKEQTTTGGQSTIDVGPTDTVTMSPIPGAIIIAVKLWAVSFRLFFPP